MEVLVTICGFTIQILRNVQAFDGQGNVKKLNLWSFLTRVFPIQFDGWMEIVECLKKFSKLLDAPSPDDKNIINIAKICPWLDLTCCEE